MFYRIDDLKKRKKQTKLDHESLLKKSDELSVKAEKTLKWELLAQANANRKRAQEKLVQYEEIAKKLDAKVEQLKN